MSNTLRFVHTADWHLDGDPTRIKKAEQSLKQLVKYCEVKVNAIIIAGDIWEKKQSYAERSGVPLGVKYLKILSHLVDFIFIVKGNNAHDEPGSIDLLHQIEPNIYAYEKPVCLAVINGSDVRDLLSLENQNSSHTPEYIVSLVPYPTKAMFVTNNSLDNNNAEFIQMFEQVFELIADTTAEYNCPKILAFHGNVVGSRLSSGQSLVSQDIMVAPSTLQKANHDYYALGHIHLRQFFFENMGYSGSLYNKSWGETEQKSFAVVEFNEGFETPLVMTRHQIFFEAARPMIKIDARFDPIEGDFISLVEHSISNCVNSEIRYRCTIEEADRKLVTEDKIKELVSSYASRGNTLMFEPVIIPSNRESRSEEIMNCKSLLDEVKEYASVIKEEITTGTENKVYEVLGEPF